MLNYFTTWNNLFILIPTLRNNHSRALLTLSSSISFAGIVMWITNFKKNTWSWKNIKTNFVSYSLLDIIFHQGPLAIALYQQPSGNALHALIPTAIYSIFIPNPYKIAGYKLKNYQGLLLVGAIAPAINYLTTNNSKRFIQQLL